MKLFIISLLLFVSQSLLASNEMKSQSLNFASNTATVEMPADITIQNNTDHLLGKFGENQDHLIEISFNPLPQNSNLSGVDFIKQQAAKKGSKVKEAPGRAVFMESAGDTQKNGKTFRIVHWQIGVKEGVFVLTITVPVPMSKDLNDFLGNGLNQIVNSVSANAL
jgi:hypothetical protein